MKIRFSKVATLFLAGAAVLAAGCTDYQSDINDIYVKIDELSLIHISEPTRPY